MPRAKTGTVRKQGHKKILSRTKGFRMTRNRLYKVAKEATLHQGKYAYKGRKERKSQMRQTWISRITAALSLQSEYLSYSKFIKALSDKKITLNRKSLSALATKLPSVFSNLVSFSNKK